MYIRKDFLDLTSEERDRLADSFNELFDRGRITLYADVHDASPDGGWFNIHRGPAFLPWHRWYLLQMEQELRAIDDRIALPYWDWTRPEARNLDVEPWKSFFGGRNNTGGQFDHWDYTRSPTPSFPDLATADDVRNELQTDSYAEFRGMEVRSSHVGGHTWTGGTMASPRSPSDPLFYLHHGMVDRLWAIWQGTHSAVDQYTLDNSPASAANLYPATFVAKDDLMFSGALGGAVTPASMLDHRALGYLYQGEERILAAEGKVTFLRAHDVGTGWGPSEDFLDVEVVIKLDSSPNRAFGFQLRNDANERVQHGMLDLLRDAFNHDRRIRIDYVDRAGLRNGRILRVMDLL